MLLPLSAAQAQAPADRAAPLSKLAPPLQLASPATARSSAAYRVQVTDAAAFRRWARQYLPAARLQAVPGQPQLLTVNGPATPAALAACPYVRFVEAADRQARPERQLNGADLTANTITAVHARYPQLTGQGLTVSVKEDPIDITDIDFKGRLVNPDPQAQLLNAHSTIMTTLIAGGGNSSPNGKGAAWQARIAQSSSGNLLPDDGPGLAAQGVSVQNHSYGVSVGVENFYGLEARAYDAQARQYPALVHVFSAGNVGSQPGPAATAYAGLASTANLTGEFKNAKNSLSVGNTDALGQVVALSSRGPAADGRVKPELVAYGSGGSSDAAALVSGISLLAQHAYRERRGTLPPAALVRAALLNTADDAGRPNVDFVAGYGQADALGAVQTMLDGRFVEGSVAQGQEQVFPITVPAGTHRLKITLAWTDPEAAANAASTLVNDLDLALVRPADGQRWLPWTLSAYPHLDSLARPARRRPNHRDNAEQVTLDLPAAGTYELRVRGYQLGQGPQTFSVAYELENGLTWIHPSKARNLRAGEEALLRWQWAGPATTARLEYQPLGQTAWTTVSSSLDLTQQTCRWMAPATPAAARLRLFTGTGAVVSDTFFVARPLTLDVAYTCTDETLLTWPRVPGATQYQVYRLGASQLEPYRLLPDTALRLTAAEAAARYYAVAPVLQGRAAERGSSIDVTDSRYGCYVRSFLPRQLVMDTIQFNLTLGTTYRLQAIALERRNADGSFFAVQTLTSNLQLATRLTDPQPRLGRAEYRARLQLSTGQTLYSQVEAVNYVPAVADVLVYPVPVAAGEPLSVVGPPDQILRVRLFDVVGRVQRDETTDTSVIKELDTHGLQPGTYLLRVSIPGGREVTRRILVL
ncbi:S8 family serine peptidase [Hymenobacter jeollabukensis]|uniref:T9SS type A sorting domain-containing protein n=1 Tax=Hymenobacter jeollabukensis TaxID=2025313 RepID=A0A5R8WPF1_9BACT|nr:S8 family serine peptidase [Hymenobacter jeollabukensis]TLM92206.1 T9SS type A sorting domain-containing protein [Hymenobacter jeollabukensis]